MTAPPFLFHGKQGVLNDMAAFVFSVWGRVCLCGCLWVFFVVSSYAATQIRHYVSVAGYTTTYSPWAYDGIESCFGSKMKSNVLQQPYTGHGTPGAQYPENPLSVGCTYKRDSDGALGPIAASQTRSFSCPEGEEWDFATQQCVVSAPCPEAGTRRWFYTRFTDLEGENLTINSVEPIVEFEGCQYQIDNFRPGENPDCMVEESAPSDVWCSSPYISIATPGDGTNPDPDTDPDIESTPDAPSPPYVDLPVVSAPPGFYPELDKDTRTFSVTEDTSTVNYGPGHFTVTITTERRTDQNTKITEGPDGTKAVVKPDGDREVTTETKETVENPDGSKVETVTTVTEDDPGETVEVIVDKDNPEPVVDTYDHPSTVTHNTTTITNYDSGGNITYQNTTGDTAGSGTGSDGEGSGGDCDPAYDVGCDTGDEPYQFQGDQPTDPIYESGQLTYQQAFSDFQSRLVASPIIGAADGFFSFTLSSGSCPTWVIPATWVFDAMPIDAQCSPAMAAIWPYIQAVVLATAAFYGFRIAFL